MKKVLIAAALVAGAVAVPQAAQATTCSTAWGSQVKAVASSAHTSLSGLRAGRHACFDRLVLDRTGASGYQVRYVSAVRDQGQGAVVPLKGGALLQVDVSSSASRRPAVPGVAGFTTLRQVGWGGSFEGSSTVGLGVRARLPFRVFTSGPDLVIDVAHHW
jgi:hypothetical protein